MVSNYKYKITPSKICPLQIYLPIAPLLHGIKLLSAIVQMRKLTVLGISDQAKNLMISLKHVKFIDYIARTAKASTFLLDVAFPVIRTVKIEKKAKKY